MAEPTTSDRAASAGMDRAVPAEPDPVLVAALEQAVHEARVQYAALREMLTRIIDR